MRLTSIELGSVFLLTFLILISGCVTSEPRTVDAVSTINVTIVPTLKTSTETSISIVVSATTIPSYFTGFSPSYREPERVQCGENLCPTNWFCCNKVCYNPKDSASASCCGNSPCPQGWECCYTKNGLVCYNPKQYACVDINAAPTYTIVSQSTPYPVCVNMPDGSTKCPGFGGSWDKVQTPSPLSYAIKK